MIGHGYVGLVTACIFADEGNKVNVIGRTPEKIKKLNSGDPLIFEPGLEKILKKNLKNGNLHFSLDYDCIRNSQVVFIGVGTPSQKNGSADLKQVKEVAKKIAQNLGRKFTVISCKSTVPVGTNKEIDEIIKKNAPQESQYAVASCPEFLREGTGVRDTLHPDRVVIGSESKKAIDVLLELHKPIGGKRVITDLASAELIKYASNSILATKISFSNFIAQISEVAGANAEVILESVGLDKRVSDQFLRVGIGYGGACFPKDVKALAFIGKKMELDTGLLDNVEKVNFKARKRFAKRIVINTQGKKLAIWGLSFKPDTDDIREAPSRDIIKYLLNEGYQLSVYDPQAMEHIEKIFGNKLTYHQDKIQALDGAEGLVILTEWDEFKDVDLKSVKKLLKYPIIFDGRNIYDPVIMKKLGFEYYSVGRRDIK